MQPEALTRVLVHIQAHLDEDLPLERLANCADLSPHHFQRSFRATLGESPRCYVERLRLERGAFRLSNHAGSVLDVAIECGFSNHDTFTRAFRRRFGRTPTEHRRSKVEGNAVTAAPPDRSEVDARDELSNTRLVQTRSMELAFIRHLGPYEEVPASLWDELMAWSTSLGEAQPDALLGIGHDAPGLTEPAKLRFDAAILTRAGSAPRGRIGRTALPAGDWALTTHSGPYASLTDAYPSILERIRRLRGVQLIGLPLVEIYRTTRIRPDLEVNYTDVYVPVSRVG